MLINWFLTAFSEDHYLRMILTPQDLKILVAQFATHLLAAGVIKQIADKDAPLEILFRVSIDLKLFSSLIKWCIARVFSLI